MGLMRKAVGEIKGKKGQKMPKDVTLEDTYGIEETEEEEEQPSLMDLFAQWTASKLKQEKSKRKLAEVD